MNERSDWSQPPNLTRLQSAYWSLRENPDKGLGEMIGLAGEGCGKAMLHLSHYYLENNEFDEAERWLRLAADDGPEAQFFLARFLTRKHRYSEAKSILESNVSRLYIPSTHLLGLLSLIEIKGNPDLIAAEKNLEVAYKAGSVPAKVSLGLFLIFHGRSARRILRGICIAIPGFIKWCVVAVMEGRSSPKLY